MKRGMEYPEPDYEGDEESLISFDRQQIAESFGATPLERTKRQTKVFYHLRKRFVDNRPASMSDAIYSYMLNHFEMRFLKRQQRNTDSYLQRLEQDDSIFEAEQIGLIELANRGLAYPGELLDVRDLLGMGNIELGRVTHPYGPPYLEDLEGLRAQTEEAIRERGGHVFDFHEYEDFEVEDTDRRMTLLPTVGSALLMVRTRIIGVLPDQTEVRERSSFILNLEKIEDGYIRAKIQNALRDNGHTIDEQIQAVVNIQRLVAPMLEKDDHEVAIPLSSTMFAFHQPTLDAVYTLRMQQWARTPIPQSSIDLFLREKDNPTSLQAFGEELKEAARQAEFAKQQLLGEQELIQ